jgi:hypothetical protein
MNGFSRKTARHNKKAKVGHMVNTISSSIGGKRGQLWTASGETTCSDEDDAAKLCTMIK